MSRNLKIVALMFVAHLESGDRTITLMMTLTQLMRVNHSLLSKREDILMRRQTLALNVSLSITIISPFTISHLLKYS